MAISLPPAPRRIFISYRRDETDFAASWLYERLASHFGRDQIFKDVDSIELGDDFHKVITLAVQSCDVLLALIGDRWVEITDEKGRRRLENPDDFVRIEIAAALERDIRVIPILIGNTSMPRAEQLPPSLASLVRREALQLHSVSFESDTGRLMTVLERALEASQRETEPDALGPDGAAVWLGGTGTFGSMSRYELARGETSRAVMHRTVEEIWYVISGHGEMWRADDHGEEVIRLEPNITVKIPAGTRFQFRASDAGPLRIVVSTMPPWPGEDEAMAADGPWTPRFHA